MSRILRLLAAEVNSARAIAAPSDEKSAPLVSLFPLILRTARVSINVD